MRPEKETALNLISASNVFLGRFGLVLKKTKPAKERKIETWPVEFDSETREFISYVYEKNLTLVSPFRLFATAKAAIASCENGVGGDFVECGVWRGGNSILAALLFQAKKSRKRVVLFDTFAGMTAPIVEDFYLVDGTLAKDKFEASQQQGYNDWCYASRDEVRYNFKSAGIEESRYRLVEGAVESTLGVKKNLPRAISTLRLDTDWYESTKIELEVLYPLLSQGGQLVIDDYGSWNGARKAVTEYLESLETPPPLHLTDYDGRVAMKMFAGVA